MKIVWRAGLSVMRPENAVKIKGINEMEGWHGGGSRIPTHPSEEEMTDEDTGFFPDADFKDETADPVNAFTFQGELIELDKQFASLHMENADVFVSARLWDDETDSPTAETIRIAPGEELTPYRLRLGTGGEMQFLVWWNRDEHTRAPLMLKRGDLADVLPETYLITDSNFRTAIKNHKRYVSILERENCEAIGSRQRVIQSLNAAIRSRSEIDLLTEMKRQEAERAKAYEDDDSAGMF